MGNTKENGESESVLLLEKSENHSYAGAIIADQNSDPSSLSNILADAPLGRYHAWTMVSVFFGYCARHSILDMTPVLSTRLYVEMDLTPELESVFAIVTFVGITLSFLLSGLIAGRIGRKTCAILGTGWMVLWNILCGCAWNIEVLILLRFLMSLGACKYTCLIGEKKIIHCYQ